MRHNTWYLLAIAFVACVAALYLTQPVQAGPFAIYDSPVFSPISPPETSTVPTSGAALTTDDMVQITFPAGAVTQTTVITYVAGRVNHTQDKTGVGRFFELTATQEGNRITHFDATIVFTVPYPLGYNVRDDNIRFYWLNGTAWVTDGLTTTIDSGQRCIVGYTDHFTTFGLLGDDKMVYLPLVFKLQ
jgi:hypothetical protein